MNYRLAKIVKKAMNKQSKNSFELSNDMFGMKDYEGYFEGEHGKFVITVKEEHNNQIGVYIYYMPTDLLLLDKDMEWYVKDYKETGDIETILQKLSDQFKDKTFLSKMEQDVIKKRKSK